MLYTSYYKNIDYIRTLKEDYTLVSISVFITENIKNSIDIWDKSLAPSWSIFKEFKECKKYKKFTKRFKSEILTQETTLNSIQKYVEMSKDKNIVLLCYELPNQFCHRYIVKEYIENNYDIDINEIGLDSSYIMNNYKYDKVDENKEIMDDF